MENEIEKINIDRFLDEFGLIAQLPKKQKIRRAVLEYLIEKFEKDRKYTEKEINEICNRWHTFGDYFLLRRELIDAKLLSRHPNGSEYWRT